MLELSRRSDDGGSTASSLEAGRNNTAGTGGVSRAEDAEKTAGGRWRFRPGASSTHPTRDERLVGA